MLSTVLFISSGELFVIFLFILIFFGAEKIPEFARIMGKGVREFKKATDDIKRELNESSAGVLNEIKSIQTDLADTLTKEIAEPLHETISETEKTLKEYQDQYNSDYYYNNQDEIVTHGNEYRDETQTSDSVQSTEA